MRAMAAAQEFIQAAPPGLYTVQFDAVEALLSSKNESMLKISGSIADGAFKGSQFFHNIGTDGGTKFGGMGKKHLRSLGINVDTDADVPDSVIAAKLQGLRLQAQLGNEPRKQITKGVNGAPDIETAVFAMDPKSKQQIPIMNLSVIGYIREPGAFIDLGIPVAGQQQGAPQGYAPQAGQPGVAPQGYPPGYAPQGYVPPQAAGGFPPGAPAGLPPGVGGAPVGYPPGYGAPAGAAPGFAPGTAAPPWNGAAPVGAPGGAPAGLPPGMGVAPVPGR